MKHLFTVAVAMAALALSTASAAEVAQAPFDRWYVLQMQGQRAGYAHISRTIEDDVITTSNDLRISVRRGSIAMSVTQQSTFEETAAGDPIAATSTLNMGTMGTTTTYRFTDEGIEVTAGQGDRQQVRMLPPIEGDWLTPAAAQRYVETELERDAEQITLRTVDLSMGVQPVQATMTLRGREDIEVFGRTVPAIGWDMAVDAMPGMQMREYVDDQGQTLKTTVSLGGGLEVTMLAADEQLATSEVDPPEVLASMMISPSPGSAAMNDPRSLRVAVYEVRLKPDVEADGFELARAGYQRVAWGDQRTARVVVDLDRPVNPVDDLPTDAHTAASITLDHADPKIRELVEQALENEAQGAADADKAERLRAFVHSYLTEKSLAVGFATASETARTREGDCTEHAVLLAAMLRAADIPSRTATGLVYVDQFVGQREVFGGHMWTQAWIDDDEQGGRWVDVDATLPGGGFDAAHITLGVAALDDGQMVNELVRVAPTLGSLEVRVIEAR